MIRVEPYEDLPAKAVLDRLDPADLVECQLISGQAVSGLTLWADWRAVQAFRIHSHVAWHGSTPFAIFGLSRTGQAGVAGAALLARDHAAFRPSLLRLAVMIRRSLPGVAEAAGIHRIEARSWAGHPVAPRLLRGLGFVPEVTMRGFGLTGTVSFTQWAWLAADHQPHCPVSACQNANQEPAPCV